MQSRWIAVALLVLAGLSGAQAQNYPTRTGTVIVPFAAGGPADITGRIVADIFSRHLGQQFVVENVVGAGGTVGALRAARANPDGYTIISGHMGTHAAAPAFYPNLGYDPQKDFEPIGLIAEQPELLAVRKDLPASAIATSRITRSHRCARRSTRCSSMWACNPKASPTVSPTTTPRLRLRRM